MKPVIRDITAGLLALACSACVPTALAQPGDDAEPSRTDAGRAANPLRGPEVPASRTRTLVRRTMTGELDRLRVRPEIAALQELGLDAEAAEAARRIVEDRTRSVTLMLVDELDRVRAMTDLAERGERDAARELLGAMWSAYEPGRPRAPLIEPLGEILTDAQRADLNTLVDEYFEAWIDWELRQRPERRADEAVRARVSDRLARQLFEREVREGYNGSLRRYREAIEGIADAVDPTPAQREAIRTIVIEHIKATRLEATPAERRATHMAIYRMLDDGRKEKLFAYMTRIVVPDGG